MILPTPSDTVTQERREAFQELATGGRPFCKLRRPLTVVFTASELEPASNSPSTFHFDFEHYLRKKDCKGFQNSKIVN